MQVIILEAGASKAAGYPLTNELLPAVEHAATATPAIQFRDAWDAWDQFIASYSGPLELVLRNPNPEVILSLPDLFFLALASQDEDRMRGATTRGEDPIEERVAQLEEYFGSEAREGLSAARVARSRLLSALRWYFWFKHHDDIDNRPQREYLHTALDSLTEGDAIVTLNWDTLAERVLAERRQWSPLDGYGFERDLYVSGPLGKRSVLPADLTAPSQVRVLKLHGSFGWCDRNDGLYLEGTRLLQGFNFHHRGRPIALVDSAEPTVAGVDDMLVAYPSFLKDLSHPVLAGIWKEASAAFLAAESVQVWGYSLPASDAAMRALLQPLAVRCDAGEVRVQVMDPKQSTLDRWQAALGSHITTQIGQLGAVSA